MPKKRVIARIRVSLMLSLVVILTLWSTTFAKSDEEAKPKLKFSGATGGIVRFPNTNQEEDRHNAFAEAWIKADVELWRRDNTVLRAYVLGNYVRDTKPYDYNNTTKAGIGLSLSARPHDDLEVTLSARHDWFGELDSTTRREGWRVAIDYYYYKYFEAKEPRLFWGMTKRANVLKSYGTLEFPGSLVRGDDNLVLTLGAEYSADYVIPDSSLLMVPFVDVNFAWDVDANNYNNKLIPSIGVKMRKPLERGEIFWGVRYEVDYRWVENTVDTGPMVFLGWYKGF